MEALCESVKVTVELQTKMEDGKTKLDHLIQVEESTGRSHIPEVDVPAHGEHILTWFWSLSNARGSSGFGGPSPLSYTEIMAWKSLTKTKVYAWEIEALMTLDAAYMQAASEISTSKNKQHSKSRK